GPARRPPRAPHPVEAQAARLHWRQAGQGKGQTPAQSPAQDGQNPPPTHAPPADPLEQTSGAEQGA
ncbi:MAG: hypothetical protein ABF636_12460, partial [Acetobacter sp.]